MKRLTFLNNRIHLEKSWITSIKKENIMEKPKLTLIDHRGKIVNEIIYDDVA